MIKFHPAPGNIQALALAGLLMLVLALYRFGLGGTWMFDDHHSLQGLAKVVDFSSAWQYVFSGTAGPSGRPLALASFLINVSAWPDDPAAFRLVSVMLHCLNGLLLYFLIRSVARQSGHARSDQVALAASALWLLHPLLASSVLSVVQRMVPLATLFVLLGLLGYVRGRAILATRPRLGLVVMSASLAGGALMGVMAKESAALLPLFAAVIEFCFPASRSGQLSARTWLAWRLVFFLGPVVLLAASLVIAWPGFEATYRMRSFDLGQRLASETVILWEYLRQLLIPQPRGFGVFHDDQVARQVSDPVVWLAALAWAATVAAALLLRRRAPWFTFAVGGYLVGHLIESTVIPLELYFEHRNYVGAMFVLAGLAGLLGLLPGRLAVAAKLGIATVFALSLLNVTSLWGRSDLAAEMWFEAHPASARAAQFVAQQRLLVGFNQAAGRAISSASAQAPLASDLMVQSLVFDCGVLEPSAMAARGDSIAERLKSAHHSWAVFDSLTKLDARIAEGRCPGAATDLVARLAEALLVNPRFSSSFLALDHLHNLLAVKAFDRGDGAAAEFHQREAFRVSPSASNAKLVAVRLIAQNRTDAATDFLAAAMASRGRGWPGTSSAWQREVGDMLASLQAVKAGAMKPDGTRQ